MTEVARHFAPYGQLGTPCGVTLPSYIPWDYSQGEYLDEKFTTRRAQVTCVECRKAIG